MKYYVDFRLLLLVGQHHLTTVLLCHFTVKYGAKVLVLCLVDLLTRAISYL